jgi:hypothetical protein
MPKVSPRNAATLPDWSALNDLDRKALAVVWQRAFGRPLPPRLYRAMVLLLLSYRLQELQFGGLSPAAERYLASLLPRSDGKPQRPAPRRLRAGARLLRTWQGRTYAVTVTDSGFSWEGQTYRSLSHIARKITGTPWSGPAFFGLNKMAKSAEAKA